MINIMDTIKSLSLLITIYNLNVVLLKNIGFRISQRNSFILSNIFFKVIFFYSLVYNLSKNIYITAFIGTCHFFIKFFLTPPTKNKNKKVIDPKRQNQSNKPPHIPLPGRTIASRGTTPQGTTPQGTTPQGTTVASPEISVTIYDNDTIDANYIEIREIPKKLLEITLLILMSITFTKNLYIIVILVIIYLLNNNILF